MARNKTGFAYFNIDTDRYQDIRIKRLKKDFGCTGISVYDYILCEIYRVKGCFIVWDSNTAFDVAEYFSLKESTVNEIVSYCCSAGLFNKALFTNEKILSSRSIQERYLEMCIRAKRKEFKIPEEIDIIREEYAEVTEECIDTSGSLQQSKVEYSKVEESKEIERVIGAPPEISFSEQLRLNESIETSFNRKPKIPTKEQVWEAFVRGGGTKEMAKKFWDECESTSWYRKGSPITNFVPLVNKFIQAWKEIEAKQKPGQISIQPKTKSKTADEIIAERQEYLKSMNK